MIPSLQWSFQQENWQLDLRIFILLQRMKMSALRVLKVNYKNLVSHFGQDRPFDYNYDVLPVRLIFNMSTACRPLCLLTCKELYGLRTFWTCLAFMSLRRVILICYALTNSDLVCFILFCDICYGEVVAAFTLLAENGFSISECHYA